MCPFPSRMNSCSGIQYSGADVLHIVGVTLAELAFCRCWAKLGPVLGQRSGTQYTLSKREKSPFSTMYSGTVPVEPEYSVFKHEYSQLPTDSLLFPFYVCMTAMTSGKIADCLAVHWLGMLFVSPRQRVACKALVIKEVASLQRRYQH